MLLRLASLIGVWASVSASASADCGLGHTVAVDGQQVFTLSEAASFLLVDDALLEEAVTRGEVPGRRFGDEWRFARAALMAWLAGSEEPADCFEPHLPPIYADATASYRANDKREFVLATVARLAPQEMAAVVGSGLAAPPLPPQARTPPAPGSPATPPSTSPPRVPPALTEPPDSFGEAPGRDSAREVALRREIVLTPKGAFSAELDLLYSQVDQDLSTLSPLGLAIATRHGEQFGIILTGRYGIRDNLELILSLPWIRETEEVSLSTFGEELTLSESSSSRFDDARFGVQFGALAEGLRNPSVVLSGEGRVPLDGSNAYSIGAGVSVVKSFDPVALFGSAAYLHTFNADSRDLFDLAPEESFSAVAGFALAMNDRLSLSTSLNATFTPRTEVGSVVFDSDKAFNLRFALTGLVGDNFYIEPAVSVRLNGPADAFAFGLSIPYDFGN